MRRCPVLIFVAFLLAGCATGTTHKFAEPGRDWAGRTGQLLYRTATTSLIGEVVVRSSKIGDFELTFSKGPGMALFQLRQDNSFAEVRGAIARSGWAGPISNAPAPLRPWLELRNVLRRSAGKKTIRHVSGTDTFVFRF